MQPIERDDFSSNRHPALSFLFEHDLRANASRLSRGKTGTHFSGSCSGIGAFLLSWLHFRPCPDASAGRCPARIDSDTMVMMLSAFQPRPHYPVTLRLPVVFNLP